MATPLLLYYSSWGSKSPAWVVLIQSSVDQTGLAGMSNAQVVFLSEPLTFRSFQVWPRSLFKEKMTAMLVTRGPLKLPEFLSAYFPSHSLGIPGRPLTGRPFGLLRALSLFLSMGANTCHLDLLGLLQATQPEQSHEASSSRVWKINFLLGIQKEERKEGEETDRQLFLHCVCVCCMHVYLYMWGHTCGVQVLVHVED